MNHLAAAINASTTAGRPLEGETMKIERRKDTPESRAFWAAVERNAATARTWPEWKRAGVSPYRTQQDQDEAERK